MTKYWVSEDVQMIDAECPIEAAKKYYSLRWNIGERQVRVIPAAAKSHEYIVHAEQVIKANWIGENGQVKE